MVLALNLVLRNLSHQMRTIQLVNHESVPCYWSIAEEVKPFKKVQHLSLSMKKAIIFRFRKPKEKNTNFISVMSVSGLGFIQVDKFLPLYERKKVLQERRPPPVVFEMIPSSGLLSPGERVNVQIKFSPAEEVKGIDLRVWHSA